MMELEVLPVKEHQSTQVFQVLVVEEFLQAIGTSSLDILGIRG
jgi:hypothetical protein